MAAICLIQMSLVKEINISTNESRQLFRVRYTSDSIVNNFIQKFSWIWLLEILSLISMMQISESCHRDVLCCLCPSFVSRFLSWFNIGQLYTSYFARGSVPGMSLWVYALLASLLPGRLWANIRSSTKPEVHDILALIDRQTDRYRHALRNSLHPCPGWSDNAVCIFRCETL